MAKSLLKKKGRRHWSDFWDVFVFWIDGYPRKLNVQKTLKRRSWRSLPYISESRIYERIFIIEPSALIAPLSIRKATQHKLSTDIVQHYHNIGMETLNVKGMLKNHKLSRHISDAGWYQFKMMMKYKLEARGGILVEADQFFASTKTMSCCDVKLEHVIFGHFVSSSLRFPNGKLLTLSDRTLTCPSCGIVHDRDINSARNLRDIGWDYCMCSTRE